MLKSGVWVADWFGQSILCHLDTQKCTNALCNYSQY